MMTAVLPPYNLHSATMGTSFTARKIANPNLPGPIELPSNPITAKFGAPLSSLHSQPQTHQQQSSINNLLTPPSTIHGESLSPISSGSSSNNAAANGLPPYTPTGYWQASGTGLTPFLATGVHPTAPPASNQTHQSQSRSWGFPAPRDMFSPSLVSQQRHNTTSPAVSSEGQPAPNYDLGALPPFPSSLSQPGSLPPVAAQHPPHMAYMTTQGHVPNMPTQTSPGHPDPYMQRPPPTPTSYYGSQPSTTPQQAQFPNLSASSPVNSSPMAANPPVPRISPIHQPIQQFSRSFHQPYPMPGSMMHASNPQMSMVGGPGMMPAFNSGHAAHMQQMYGGHGTQPQADRPFKCDQCPQSFNRNHDLKRHKRIHLAVKPFPCGHCDKSFSRKDALKRHILVKGCGKALADGSRKPTSSSPDPKDESSEEDNAIRQN